MPLSRSNLVVALVGALLPAAVLCFQLSMILSSLICALAGLLLSLADEVALGPKFETKFRRHRFPFIVPLMFSALFGFAGSLMVLLAGRFPSPSSSGGFVQAFIYLVIVKGLFVYCARTAAIGLDLVQTSRIRLDLDSGATMPRKSENRWVVRGILYTGNPDRTTEQDLVESCEYLERRQAELRQSISTMNDMLAGSPGPLRSWWLKAKLSRASQHAERVQHSFESVEIVRRHITGASE